MGDAIATNLFMLGFAFQKGYVPLSADALLKAIEINGVGVKSNQSAFRWGRKAAVDLVAVRREAMPAQTMLMPAKPQTLEALVADRIAFLTNYQNAEYAEAYRSLVERVQTRESTHRQSDVLTKAVASNLFKLMAYKDEYEVARLHSDGRLIKKLSQEFEGNPRLCFHLSPPLLGKRDAAGKPSKVAFGAWMLPAFGVLAKLRFLRGTAFDPFGYTEERRQERRLVAEYKQLIEELLQKFETADFNVALNLVRLPEQIRGFGHVKQAALDAAKIRRQALRDRLFTANAAVPPTNPTEQIVGAI
jgi:indolepyruvate ferredoxin oxidoreductase